MIPNRTLIGTRGSGKSVSLEVMMTEVARDASILLIDWPGTLADRMTGRLWEMGLEGKLVADRALRTDRVPQWPFRAESHATDPLARRMEGQAATENFLAGLFSRRYQKDGRLSPNTYRSAHAAVSVYYGIPQAVRPPIHAVAHLFRIKDDTARWMLAETADRESANVFFDAQRLAARAPQQWDYLVGAGGRLLDVLNSPAVWARSGTSLDWKALVRGRKHFYLGMGGLPQTTATSLAVFTYTPAIQAARELFEEKGRPHPLVVVLEEAGALGLVTPVITTAMQAYRKHGVSVWVASQTVHDFQDEETFESLLAMSEHYWHQMTSGVERAARDCANPTFDAGRVIHSRERTAVHRYERVPAETVRFDEHGSRRGVSRGVVYRPVLGVQVDEVYDNPGNHEAVFRRQLSTLGVGQRVFRGLDGAVRRESVALPPDPWGPFSGDEITLAGKTDTLANHRLDAAFGRIRSSALYQPPPVWNPPPSPPPSGPAPTRNPRTGAAPSGMRGS